MWALLIVPPWLALAARALLRPGRAGEWREAALRATLAWAAGLAVLSELLGLGHQLRPVPIRAAWGAASLVAVAWLVRHRPALRGLGLPRGPSAGRGVALLAGATGVLVLAAALAAVLSPPNTPDVLSYHLPRQLMWLQQGSLEHFATANQRELKMPPFSEMVGLQLLALTGGDRLANLPEFAAYVLSILAVSLLARACGGGRGAQALAAFLWASVPMAYLEASSAKNDLLLALWVVLAAEAVLREDGPGPGWRGAWPLGCAVGLAALTKGTGLLFTAPLLAYLGLRAVRSPAARRTLAVVVVAAVALAGPHYGRNLRWYGTPFGRADAPDQEEANALWTPAALASNAVRDAAVQFALPWAGANRAVEDAVRRIHRALGLDPADPRTTLLGGQGGFAVSYQPALEMAAAAPAQALLLLLLPLGMLARRGAWAPRAWALLGLAAGAALLFALAVKWQPWIPRLELSLFALGLPLVGLLGGTAAGRLTALGWAAAALAAAGVIPAFNGVLRPLWGEGNVFTAGRDELEYRFYPALEEPGRRVAALLLDSRARRVRFGLTRLDWSYPIARRLRAAAAPVELWGAPGGPPPDAVVLAAGGARPLLLQEPGSPERLLATGDEDPYAVYLGASLLARQFPGAVLPRFTGWTDAEHLDAGRLHFGASAVPVETLVGAGARIQVDAPGSPLVIRGVVRTLVHPVRRLRLTVAGRTLAVVDLGGPGEHPFSGSAEKPPGPAWVQLDAEGCTPGERDVVFLRLQAFDPAAVPASLRRDP
jgi:hypothetical protein